ncbi:MAG TPA: TadE/TadG family type IV pilus assembly protein [Sphingomicrobium sp.]|nr:TadE/TadG family type IV pilus assembly protein [Sphingomicrobium sp.]
MMARLLARLIGDRGGNAAVEMAMVTPLLLTLMLGCAELGNYFWNEHTLLKAVRDGARFAARQPFANYSTCTGSPGGTVVTDTQNVVMYGALTGSNKLTPNITASNISVTQSCFTTVGSQTMTGLYTGDTNGAHVVTVAATVTYRPVIAVALGFSGVGTQLYAQSQAAVSGL